jgi:DNA-binding transcriptional LysR family regulator
VVSHHVSKLEGELGVRLVQRSTRHLRLTEEGRQFYLASRQVLDTATTARAALASTQEEVAGSVRLTASYNLGVTFLPAYLRRFRDKYPKVHIDLVLEDAMVNLIADGYDLALRVSWGRQPNLIGRKLCEIRLVLCASQEYLRRQRAPRQPAELLTHPWISITRLPSPERLSLQHEDGRKATVNVGGAIRTNTGIAARELIRSGLGVGQIPDFAIREDLAQGRLVELLPGWRSRRGVVSVVYPHRDNVSTRTRRLVELLVEEFHRDFGGARPAAQ